MTASQATTYCNSKLTKGVCSTFPVRCDLTCNACTFANDETADNIVAVTENWVVTWRIAYISSLRRRRLSEDFAVAEHVRKAIVEHVPLIHSPSDVNVNVANDNMTVTVLLSSQQNASEFVALVAIMDSHEFEVFVKHMSKNIDAAVRHALDVREKNGMYTPGWLEHTVDMLNADPFYNRIVENTRNNLLMSLTDYGFPATPPAQPPLTAATSRMHW